MSVCRHRPEDQPVGICSACLQDNIKKLEQKLFDVGIDITMHRNGDGVIVCIGDTQWVNSGNGPVSFVVKRLEISPIGSVVARARGITQWYHLYECYSTKETLETFTKNKSRRIQRI